MEDNVVNLTAVIAVVIVAAMFLGKVRQFSIADVDAGAAVGPWFSLWIKGKNTQDKSAHNNQED
jgi:hypothetical protein